MLSLLRDQVGLGVLVFGVLILHLPWNWQNFLSHSYHSSSGIQYDSSIHSDYDVSTQATQSTVMLSSVRYVIKNLHTARQIEIAAYSLTPRQAITHALAEAASRGAHVVVFLGRATNRQMAYARAQNKKTFGYLKAHDVTVNYTSNDSHLKAAVIDNIAYLCDRNWSSQDQNETTLADSSPEDVRIIKHGIEGMAQSNKHLWMRKADALKAETVMASRRISAQLDVETESFGAYVPMIDVLLKRVKSGDRVRLIVAEREYRENFAEQSIVHHLQSAGVLVRLGSTNEKMLLDGDYVWIGSANATSGVPDQMDFGLTLHDTDFASLLHRRFAEQWDNSAPATNTFRS